MSERSRHDAGSRSPPISSDRHLSVTYETSRGSSTPKWALRPLGCFTRCSPPTSDLGRLSIQTDPTLHHDPSAMLRQSVALGPNMQVKMPATSAGWRWSRTRRFQGVIVNVTVSFSVPQVIAIAEAVERGLIRRARSGLDTVRMAPVATMMIGRLDDWTKVVADRDRVALRRIPRLMERLRPNP